MRLEHVTDDSSAPAFGDATRAEAIGSGGYAQEVQWWPSEVAYAGVEHRDSAYVAGYDAKAGFDVAPDVELLRRLGVGARSTLVDLGAGTGLLAAAAARICGRVVAVDPSPAMVSAVRAREARIDCIEAGFLTYEHAGEAPDAVYSRNALHHLPDAWKAVALRRIARSLSPGGVFVLRDIVYSCEPDDFDRVVEAWFAAAPADPSEGWTRQELEAHVRDEYSTFSWLLEPMLRHAGLDVRDVWYSDSRTYARYVCMKA
jgi:SAM-dependent methyltransferase